MRVSRTPKAATAAERFAGESQPDAPVYVPLVVEEIVGVSYTGEDAPKHTYCEVVEVLRQCPRRGNSKPRLVFKCRATGPVNEGS